MHGAVNSAGYAGLRRVHVVLDAHASSLVAHPGPMGTVGHFPFVSTTVGHCNPPGGTANRELWDLYRSVHRAVQCVLSM